MPETPSPSPPARARRRVVLLGATGSIGTNALRVIAAHRDRLELVGVAARSDWRGLARIASEFRVGQAALFDPEAFSQARQSGQFPPGTRLTGGPESLLGLAQLQRDANRALPPRELAGRLDLLAQRLLTLVDGFVALARAGSSDPRVFDDFDIGDAIKDAYDEVWASARARNSPINMATTEEPVMVHGDRQLLARAIVNLLSNALKFSEPETGIDLTCSQTGHEVVVKVADHGPGIAPDAASQLFQRFSRGLHRGTSDPGGAGLGLAFVRVVAEKHRGRAWVEVRGGYGAVFCVSLPAAGGERA